MSLDLEHANFLLRYLAEIILGLVVVLLSALKLLGHRAQVETIKTNLNASPVTQVEMLEHQMETATLIRKEFDKFRTEIRAELGTIHRRIDEIKVASSLK